MDIDLSQPIVGIDEAGWGSICGPLVYSSVYVPAHAERKHKQAEILEFVEDSKKLKWSIRHEVPKPPVLGGTSIDSYSIILNGKNIPKNTKAILHYYDILFNFLSGYQIYSPADLYESPGDCRDVGITDAVLAGRANYPNALIVVDGNYLPKAVRHMKNVVAIPKADGFIPACSAASILAKYIQMSEILAILHRMNWINKFQKVSQDSELTIGVGLMDHFDLLNNHGYGTKKHWEALERYGVSNEHRLHINRIREIYEKNKVYGQGTE